MRLVPIVAAVLAVTFGFGSSAEADRPRGTEARQLSIRGGDVDALGGLLIWSYRNRPKKVFHNDLRRRQQRIEQASMSRAVWISG
jgi:hypothetical protein